MKWGCSDLGRVSLPQLISQENPSQMFPEVPFIGDEALSSLYKPSQSGSPQACEFTWEQASVSVWPVSCVWCENVCPTMDGPLGVGLGTDMVPSTPRSLRVLVPREQLTAVKLLTVSLVSYPLSPRSPD